MQVRSECVSRVAQSSNDLAGGDPIAHSDGDGAALHVHHDAVFGVAMVDDDAISQKRHSRVMLCHVRDGARARVVGYIITGVGHGSSRWREDLTAPARS